MHLAHSGVKLRVSLSRLLRRVAAAAVLSVVLLACLLAARTRFWAASREMTEEVSRLTAEVSRLSQEQGMPSMVLSRHRNSICYIHTIYSLTVPSARRPSDLRSRVSGTGFVVGEGLIATNRHVVEPWYDDDDDERLIKMGAKPEVEKIMAFFPDQPEPVELRDLELAKNADLAVAHFTAPPALTDLRPLPLADLSPGPGDPVVVVGYPMGVITMLAKSPHRIYKRLAYNRDTVAIARDLAAHSLIRPSATYGHLGDVVDEKLIYDALTAQGGSGGPVFNSQGQVVAVNAAYIDGFAGGSMGISVEALKPLIAAAKAKR